MNPLLLRTRLLYLLLACPLAACARLPIADAPPPAAPTITVETVTSNALGRDWAYSVYLPPGYPTSDLRYPVLYLLHGSGGDETDWHDGQQMLDSLIRAGAVPPAIAIAPASGTSWWVDGVESFETAFVQDLIPEIDRRYRTIPEREARAVAGFSMGGYGALRYGLTYADLFSGAVLLSPAIYDAQPPEGSSARTSGAFGTPFDAARWTTLNYPQALEVYARGGRDVPIFIVVGDDDWHHHEGLRYDIEQQSVWLYGMIRKERERPAQLRVLDGGHAWEVWGPGFEEGLRYLFNFLTPPR